MPSIAKLNGVNIADIAKHCGVSISSLSKIMGLDVALGAWADWDEQEEAGLSVDQDGDGTEDTFICFFENTSAGGDETGRGGGVSGSDLVATQSGNVAGATGDPPYRDLDGSDDFFSFTQTLVDALLANANGTWTIILKCRIDSSADQFLVDICDSGIDERIWLRVDSSDTLSVGVEEDGVTEDDTTTNSISTGVDYYFVIWADGGTNKVRGGFSTSKPTKWSDFNSNERVEMTSIVGDFSAEGFNNSRKLFQFYSGGYETDADAFYVIFSSICLIDNGA